MSFISNAFGGNSGYNVTAGVDPKQLQAAQANYGTANTGLNQLAQMLMQQAQGGGPNLANQQLQNFTGQNVANQAALMAGQRGASANPALLARQIGRQGAGIQQQAAGQAAQNVLAQQLAAQQQLGGVYGTMGNLANQDIGTYVNANLGASEANAQIAQKNASNNLGILGGIAGAAGGILGGLGSSGGNMPAPISGAALAPGVGTTQAAGGYESGIEPGGQYALAAHGGEIEPLRAKLPSIRSKMPEHLQRIAAIRYPKMMAKGGEVPVKVSPGERILPPHKANEVVDGKADPIKASQPVPGKAKYKGDNYANDTVPKNVKAGSIVLPRSVTNHPNAPQMAYDFVSRVKAGHHRPKVK